MVTRNTCALSTVSLEYIWMTLSALISADIYWVYAKFYEPAISGLFPASKLVQKALVLC